MVREFGDRAADVFGAGFEIGEPDEGAAEAFCCAGDDLLGPGGSIDDRLGGLRCLYRGLLMIYSYSVGCLKNNSWSYTEGQLCANWLF